MVEVYDLSMKYEPFALKQLAGCKLWRFQKVEWINNCFHIVGRFNTAFENRVLGPLELYAIFHFLSNWIMKCIWLLFSMLLSFNCKKTYPANQV